MVLESLNNIRIIKVSQLKKKELHEFEYNT